MTDIELGLRALGAERRRLGEQLLDDLRRLRSAAGQAADTADPREADTVWLYPTDVIDQAPRPGRPPI